MRERTRTDEMADAHPAVMVTREGVRAVAPDVSPIGGLLRFARFRSRKATAEEAPRDTIPQRGRQDPPSDTARASMEAGLTRGASLFFGGRG